MGKSVSDGKSGLASAITAKGVTTKSDDTFETMINNIAEISGSKTFTLYLTIDDFSNESGATASFTIPGVKNGQVSSWHCSQTAAFNITI